MKLSLPIEPLETAIRRALNFVEELAHQANVVLFPGGLGAIDIGKVKQVLGLLPLAIDVNERNR